MWPGTTWRPQHTCRLQERPLSGLWSPTISPSCYWSWSWCILLDKQRAVWSHSIRYALRSKHRLCVLRSVGTKKNVQGGGAGQVWVQDKGFLRYILFGHVHRKAFSSIVCNFIHVFYCCKAQYVGLSLITSVHLKKTF
jgi:hypothetical protein